jgi:hypothetical protein
VVGVNANSRPAKRKGGAGFDAAVGGEALGDMPITAPATPEAQQWAGWGTALKPAHEPAVLARKPLVGTVAANVLQHGVGGLNIDGCRVETDELKGKVYNNNNTGWKCTSAPSTIHGNEQGRWPANLIHDGSDDVLALFPEAKSAGEYTKSLQKPNTKGSFWGNAESFRANNFAGETGSAARFFYTAKASRSERGKGNNHPTVKPLDLMAYLCRLITPPGGVVLDPFCGSGTTLKAALSEGFSAIGIEKDAAYFEIIESRMDGAQIGLGL